MNRFYDLRVFAAQIFVNICQNNVCIQTMHHACFFQRFSDRRRASYTVHTSLHQDPPSSSSISPIVVSFVTFMIGSSFILFSRLFPITLTDTFYHTSLRTSSFLGRFFSQFSTGSSGFIRDIHGTPSPVEENFVESLLLHSPVAGNLQQIPGQLALMHRICQKNNTYETPKTTL